MNKLFIVGPLCSQHIQEWYHGFEFHGEIHVFTIHPGGVLLPENFLIHGYRYIYMSFTHFI